MTKTFKILICFCISVVIVTTQFVLDRGIHVRLQQYGLITQAVSTYKKNWDAGYAVFSFTTDSGQQIRDSWKCSESSFNEKYTHLLVIYNRNNPGEFETLDDFDQYSLTFRILFFFIIYLPFLTFFLYLLQRNIIKLYQFFSQAFI